VLSLSLSTIFVSAGASHHKNLIISLFYKCGRAALASSPMEDGVSVQGPATCCIQMEEAQGVSTTYYLLLPT